MHCKSCGLDSLRRFSSEICIHFSGFKQLSMPGLMMFPELLICLDCGFTQFSIPESELRRLVEGSAEQDVA